jgi:CDP-4-dehydro-6-deoxyglucose reductase
LGSHSSNGLTAEEASRNIALLCCTKPESDCTVDAREIDGTGYFQIKKIPCRVADIQKLATDVMSLKLQLPSTEKFKFLAGQYVEFLLKDGKRRAYSIATAPHEEGPIELHIRHMPGGLFTDHVFGVNPDLQMKLKDILRFEGPLGSFFLREGSDKPIIFIASGTGFAPIQSIIEHAKANKIQREMHLYWGGRRPSDIYHFEKCQQWTKELPNFQFIPVVSDALPEDTWTGRTGFVHQAAMHDIPDMSGYQVYACGAPIVISSAQKDFVKQCQLPEEEFFADSFTSEADLAK